ncbi:MAG: hypothetical protein ABI167_03515 [Nitrosospira sp.]
MWHIGHIEYSGHAAVATMRAIPALSRSPFLRVRERLPDLANSASLRHDGGEEIQVLPGERRDKRIARP